MPGGCPFFYGYYPCKAYGVTIFWCKRKSDKFVKSIGRPVVISTIGRNLHSAQQLTIKVSRYRAKRLALLTFCEIIMLRS